MTLMGIQVLQTHLCIANNIFMKHIAKQSQSCHKTKQSSLDPFPQTRSLSWDTPQRSILPHPHLLCTKCTNPPVSSQKGNPLSLLPSTQRSPAQLNRWRGEPSPAQWSRCNNCVGGKPWKNKLPVSKPPIFSDPEPTCNPNMHFLTFYHLFAWR